MKIQKLVVGLIVLVLAALMLADAVLTYVADTTMFNLDQFKLMVTIDEGTPWLWGAAGL